MERTARQIIEILRCAGYETYLAGGCVRDILLNREPQDYDIVTAAKPDEIEYFLEKTIPIGRKYGVILVIRNGHHFEVASFRSDSGASDGRRPNYVTYATAEKDALRRDFTVNGLFFDPKKEKVLDYVGGQNDLHEKIIRFIGDPHQRIEEDYLRILRAVRFRNQLKFQYEPKTYQALKKLGYYVRQITQERVRDELNKMIYVENTAELFADLSDLNILEHVLPEIEAMKGVAQPLQYHQEGDVWAHSFRALDSVSVKAPLELRWAVLLHDVGKPETFRVDDVRIHFNGHCEVSAKIVRNILKRLKFSRKFVKNVVWIVGHHMMMRPLLEMTEKRRLHWYHHPQFKNLLRLFRADIMGSKPQNFDLYKEIKKDYFFLRKEEKVKPLLTGKDLLEHFKLTAGPLIGKILKQVEHEYLEENIHNKKEALIFVAKIVKNLF